jgi:hypothetical protein
MKFSLTRPDRFYSHTLISFALILGIALSDNSVTKPGTSKADSERDKITWDVNSYKINSATVLSLALPNTLGTGKIQILTGCYNSGHLALYEQSDKGLKLLRTVATVDGSITDIKLMSMDGAQNKVVVAREEKGSLRIYDLKAEREPIVLFHGPQGINKVAIADLDGDGLGDIVPISYTGKTEIWFQNDRQNGFIKRHFPNAKKKVTAMKVADFDQDGDMDVLLASDHDKSLTLLTNDGSGNFSETTLEDGITGVLDIAVVDMNLDGDMDIAYVSHREKNMQLLLNKKSGFERKKISTKLHSLNNIRVFDLRNDGRPDLVISSFDEGSIRVIENAKDGLKEHRLQAEIPSPTDIAVKTDRDSGKTVLYVSSMSKNRVYSIDMETVQ